MEWNWHASHLVTCAVASWRVVGQKKPCRNALPASALAPMWCPHMPPCISANSVCPSSRLIHFNFTPLRPLLYSVLSMNWYMLDCRATLSASSCSSGRSPVWRKRTICCAHVGACGSTTRTKGMSAAAGTPASTARTWDSAGGLPSPAKLPGQSLSGSPASTEQTLGFAGAGCSSALLASILGTLLAAASGSSVGRYSRETDFLFLLGPVDGVTDG